jgi:hypothetical protein
VLRRRLIAGTRPPALSAVNRAVHATFIRGPQQVHTMGLMRIALFSLCSIVWAAALPQDAVPVEDEPYHKTVFKNDYVQAFRVTLEPGRATAMHTHARDDVAVRLSSATTAAENLGQPVGSPQHGEAGLAGRVTTVQSR